MAELLGLPYSPWTEKARWALDMRQVGYVFRIYAPIVGEPRLRLRLGKWRGAVSVPVLFDDDGRAVADSAAIARWADTQGAGPVLFPPELDTSIVDLITTSERGLAAGRALSLARALEDEEALRELLPRALRQFRPASSVGAWGLRRTLRKYRAHVVSNQEHARVLVSVLDELRAALARTPAAPVKTVLGRFTFADIAMAQVLAFVSPPKAGLRIAPHNRRAFTDPELSAQYADLLAWRDALYDAHRPRS
jgi:glutathione S-transferase